MSMRKMSGEKSRISVLHVVILLLYLCLSVRPGVGHNEADLTQQAETRTFPKTADENEPQNSSNRVKRAVDGDDTPSTDSKIQEESSRSEDDKQFKAMMFRVFEGQLLANLDFENLPRPVNTSLPPVPDYMFRLYQHLKFHTGQQKRFKTSDSTYSEDINDIFHETIRGYHVMSENWQRPCLRYLVFNTTSQPLKENITHVELVLYMCPNSALVEPRANSRNTSSAEDTLPPLTQQHVNITITMATKRRHQHSRIHTRLPVESNCSYLPINITKMVQGSFARRQTILNFSIETSSITHPSIPHPWQFSRNEEEQRPLLVIYENILPFVENKQYNNTRRKRRVSTKRNVTTNEERTNSSTLPTIEIRAGVNWTDSVGNNTNTSDSDSLSGSPLPSISYDSNATTTNTSSSPVSYPVNCHLRRWHVSFEEMQWHHVILYPPGYSANYCWGLCPAFLDNVNSTNHAFIRSKYMLLQRLHPDIPKPFCSPIRMTPMTLLYRNKYDVIITKRFIQMVVAECSCL